MLCVVIYRSNDGREAAAVPVALGKQVVSRVYYIYIYIETGIVGKRRLAMTPTLLHYLVYTKDVRPSFRRQSTWNLTSKGVD